jgi:calcineurin-like phosphoesterase family protein
LSYLETIASDEEDVLLTADTHFDHGNIIKYCHRPTLARVDREELERRGGVWHQGLWKAGPKWKISQESIDLMNETMIEAANRLMTPKSVLIHLGDFSMWPSDASKKYAEHYVKRCTWLRKRLICGRMCIIWGNHDTPGLIKHLFDWSGLEAMVRFRHPVSGEHKSLILNHTAKAVWHKSHRGAIHAYGHSHGAIEDGLDRVWPGRRSKDVGVDNALRCLGEMRPFVLGELVGMLATKSGHSINPETPTDSQAEQE